MEQRHSDYPAWRPPFRLRLATLPPHPCAYLPGRSAVSRGLLADAADPAAFEALLDAGFRRSGQLFYQPVCPGCRSCVPIRISVETFKPSASQRRVWRRNADLQVSAGRPTLTDEKRDLYRAYVANQHPPSPSSPASPPVSATGTENRPTSRTPNLPPDDPAESLADFLYTSPVQTLEIEYRLPRPSATSPATPSSPGTLIGIGIVDITDNVLSSVYFYWHPDHHRCSLGLYSALRELELARQLGKRWYHLGYWVAGSDTMDYKSHLSDHDLLGTDGIWRSAPRRTPTSQNPLVHHAPPSGIQEF